MKLDLAGLWFKAPQIWGAVILLITATVIYMQIIATIDRLETGQETIVTSVSEMRDDLRNLVDERVAHRQFLAWLALLQAMNKDLKVPELPR